MGKSAKVIGTATLLMCSAGAAALYWSGSQAQRTYEQSLDAVNQQGVLTARTASYRRGLLGSEAVTVVTFNTDGPQYQAIARSEPDTPLKDFRLVLASSIGHLPTLSVANGGAGLIVTTRLDEQDPQQSAWLARTGLHDRFHLTTRVGTDGTSTVTFDVEPVTYQAPETGSSLDWDGLQGSFDIDELNRRIRGTVHSAAFTTRTGEAQVTLGDLRYDLDGRYADHDFFTGSQSVIIDGLRASVPPDAAGPGGDLFIDHLVLRGEARAENAALSVSSDILITDLQVAAERIPRFILSIAADNLDMVPLAELRDLLAALNTGSRQTAQTRHATQAQIQEKLRAVLAGGPRMQITELVLETGSGALKGNLALRLVQPPPADAGISALFWLTALEGEAQVAIAEPLLTRLGTSGARATLVSAYETQQQTPPSDAELDKAAAELVHTWLASLESLGMLLRENNALRTGIRLTQGKLLINGKPLQSLVPEVSSN